MEYNGSALVAMVGKDCVAMASDRRLGVQQTTVGNNMKKMFKVHDSLYMGLSGLATDVQPLAKLQVRQLASGTYGSDDLSSSGRGGGRSELVSSVKRRSRVSLVDSALISQEVFSASWC